MSPRTHLSRARIVAAAIDVLDADGERGLTFKVLTERLATGPGAIYWHVANKGELLGAATEAVVAQALDAEPTGTPQDRVRVVALGLFDAIVEHAWLGTQLATELSRSPVGSVTPRIFEGFGRQVRALGVPEPDLFTATSALVHYVLGAAGQNAANARGSRTAVDRATYLGEVSAAWAALDPDDYPFLRAMAGQLRDHDDRAQFLAGIDLILSGIGA